MSLSKDEITETFYTAGLTTLGAVGIGVASRKLTRDGLGIPTTPMPTYQQGYLPTNPFKAETKT